MKPRICILLGSAHVGGGTFVIFQHALWLEKAGYDITIVPHFPIADETLDWHPEAKKRLKFRTFEQISADKFDLAIATWWRTAYDLAKVSASKYAYFVQSIESKFFKTEDFKNRLLAEATYMFRLPTITEVSWIQNYLRENYDTSAELVLNGIRKDLFTESGEAHAPRLKSGLRVLVEGPLGVFFKNTERTLELCRSSRADEIWFLTSTPGIKNFPGIEKTFSCVPITETPKIYRSTDVIVKLSYVEGMFGPPLEQFHCGGTAIVYKVTGGEEYLAHNKNSIILEKDDEEGVIQAINSLRDSPSQLEALRSAAKETAAGWPSWDESSSKFETAIAVTLSKDSPSQSSLAFMSKNLMSFYDQMTASQAAQQSIPSGLDEELNRLRKLEAMLGAIIESKTMKIISKVRQTPGLYGLGKKTLNMLKRIRPSLFI